MKRRTLIFVIIGLIISIVLALVLTNNQRSTERFLASLPYNSNDFNIQKVSNKELAVLIFTEDLNTGKQKAETYIRSKIGNHITSFKIIYDQSRAALGTGTPEEPADTIVLPIGPANDTEDF